MANKIFDDGYGNKYDITCWYNSSIQKWNVNVAKKAKGKRKFIYLGPIDQDMSRIPIGERENYRLREILREIPWSWIAMVMDEEVASIRKEGNKIYPKDNNEQSITSQESKLNVADEEQTRHDLIFEILETFDLQTRVELKERLTRLINVVKREAISEINNAIEHINSI